MVAPVDRDSDRILLLEVLPAAWDAERDLPEVIDMLKDKSVNPNAFETLRKMRPMRQMEAAELMTAAANYSSSYAGALLAATKQTDLSSPTALRPSPA